MLLSYYLQSIAMIESNLLPPGIPWWNWKKCLHFEDFNPVLLCFNKEEHETEYRGLPDTKFKYNMLCAVFLFLCMSTVQLLSTPRYVYRT